MKRTLSLVTCALALATSGSAWASNDATGSLDVSQLGPQQQAHWAKAKAKASRPAPPPEYNYDIAAPTLSAVRVGGTVNASLKVAEAVISLTVRENLSGFKSLSVTLEGPGGQQAYHYWSSSYPDKGRQTVSVAVPMSQVTQNGTWKVKSVQVADANNNSNFYDEAQLAAMGTKTFEVVKAQGDFEMASLQSGGTNLTPVISRSTPPAGMLPGAYARVGLRVPVTDAGTSGVSRVTLNLCPPGQYWNCMYLSGDVGVRGQTSVALTVGGVVYPWMPLGSYVVESASVYDYAGNYRYYYAGHPALANLLDVSTVEVIE